MRNDIKIEPSYQSEERPIRLVVFGHLGDSTSKCLMRAEALELAARLIESVEGCDITLVGQVRQQAEFVASADRVIAMRAER